MCDRREKELRDGMLLFESERMTVKIRNVRDIFTNRHVLKQSHFKARSVNQLARLVRDALKNRTRFRVFESPRVLRSQVLAGGG